MKEFSVHHPNHRKGKLYRAAAYEYSDFMIWQVPKKPKLSEKQLLGVLPTFSSVFLYLGLVEMNKLFYHHVLVGDTVRIIDSQAVLKEINESDG